MAKGRLVELFEVREERCTGRDKDCRPVLGGILSVEVLLRIYRNGSTKPICVYANQKNCKCHLHTDDSERGACHNYNE